MTSYCVEYAKSGRSKCKGKGCGQTIEKGELRIGATYTMGDYEMTKFYHLACWPIPRALHIVENINGFHDIKLSDQTKLRDHFEGKKGGAAVKKAASKATAATTKRDTASKKRKAEDSEEDAESEEEAQKKAAAAVKKTTNKTRTTTRGKKKDEAEEEEEEKPTTTTKSTRVRTRGTAAAAAASKKKKKADSDDDEEDNDDKDDKDYKGDSGDEEEGEEDEEEEDEEPSEEEKKIAELEQDLQKYKINELKKMLARNNQKVTGTKAELIERVAQGMVFGALPMCPQCGGGRLRLDSKTRQLTCPGFMDDTHFKRCSYKAKLGDKNCDLEISKWKNADDD